MAVLNITSLTRAGLEPSTVGAAADVAGDKWVNTGTELVLVHNGGGSSITITLTYGLGGSVDGSVLTPKTVAVPAGKTSLIGPFPTGLYNDANGQAGITYSSVTSVKTLVVR